MPNRVRRIIEARGVTIFQQAFQSCFPEVETGELILPIWQAEWASRGRVEILAGDVGQIKEQLPIRYALDKTM